MFATRNPADLNTRSRQQGTLRTSTGTRSWSCIPRRTLPWSIALTIVSYPTSSLLFSGITPIHVLWSALPTCLMLESFRVSDLVLSQIAASCNQGREMRQARLSQFATSKKQTSSSPGSGTEMPSKSMSTRSACLSTPRAQRGARNGLLTCGHGMLGGTECYGS